MKKKLIAVSALVLAASVSGCSTSTRQVERHFVSDCQKSVGSSNTQEFTRFKVKDKKTGEVLFSHSSPIVDSPTPVRVNDYYMTYVASYFVGDNVFIQVMINNGDVDEFVIGACDTVVLSNSASNEIVEFSRELRELPKK